MRSSDMPSCQTSERAERYIKVKKLGDGFSGNVVLARDTVTNDDVAVKLISRATSRQHLVKYILSEIQVLKKLQHPNIVQFREVILTAQHLGIVLEFVADGNLAEYLSERGAVPEHEARWLFRQMVAAVHYCHCQNISNRDIKLDNTLLVKDTTGAGKHTVKLCDFGFAKDDPQPEAFTKLGTLDYTAPEIVTLPMGQSYDPKKSDVWSCGVALLVMLTRSFPFRRPEDKKLRNDAELIHTHMRRICNSNFVVPAHVSEGCADLIRRMLLVDPSARASMSDILQHLWLTGAAPCDASTSITPPPSGGRCTQTDEDMDRLVQSAFQTGTPVPSGETCSLDAPDVPDFDITGMPFSPAIPLPFPRPGQAVLTRREPVRHNSDPIRLTNVPTSQPVSPRAGTRAGSENLAEMFKAMHVVQCKTQDLKWISGYYADQIRLAAEVVSSSQDAGQSQHVPFRQAMASSYNDIKCVRDQLDRLTRQLGALR